MADFVSVLRRAVENLQDNNEAARHALYGKARTALLGQLRALDPPLSPEELERQTHALDAAIASVETEFALAETGQSALYDEPHPDEPQPPAPGAAPVPAAPNYARPDHPRPDQPRPAPAPAATAPTYGAQSYGAQSYGAQSGHGPAGPEAGEPEDRDEGFHSTLSATEGLGAASSDAARRARDTLGRIDTPTGDRNGNRNGDRAGASPAASRDNGTRQARPDTGPVGGPAGSPAGGPAGGHDTMFDDGDNETGGRAGRIIGWAVLLLVIAGIAGVAYWQRDTLTEMVATLTGEAVDTGDDDGKISDRVPGSGGDETETADETPATPPGQQAQPQEQTPPAADSEGQRIAQAILVEEGAGGSAAVTSGGSIDWALVDDNDPAGGAAKVIQGTVRIPDRDLGMTISIRQNLDDALPASHLVELVFQPGPNFPGDGVASVPGLLMKANPRSAGQPLVGAVVPVMDGYFLVGLSESDLDRQRNIAEMRSRDFIDIPVNYDNGGRAVLSLAKGESGAQVFADAFAAWGQ